MSLLLALLICLCYSQLVVATQLAVKPESYRWSSYAYGGYAWSKKAGISNPLPAKFANVADSDTDNDDIANTPFFGVSLQRNFNDFVSGGFSYEIYTLFNYQRYHANVSGSIEIFGADKYVRQFLMNHQAAMLEGYLKLPSVYSVELGSLQVAPLLGGGVGVGISNLFNFGTVGQSNGIVGVYDVYYKTVGSNHISKSMAWRIEAGLRFKSLESNFAFGVAYRYYHGGTFHSGPRYLFSGGIFIDQVLELPDWSGTLKSNQLKMYLEVDFN